MLLCGPFYEAVDRFGALDVGASTVQSYVFPVPSITTPVIRLVVWRINMLLNLTNQIGTLQQYFPTHHRRSIASLVYACLDSYYPLLDALEADPFLDEKTILEKKLAPETQRHSVVDYSCTYFISYLVPFILSATTQVPPLILEILQCSAGDANLQQLVEILRCITIKRERPRHLLNIIYSALRGDGASNWLSNVIVTIVKYGLLGNYPDAMQYAPFPARRVIYQYTRESVLAFLANYGTNTDHQLGTCHTILATSLFGVFSMKSIDYVPTSHLLMEQEVSVLFRNISRIMGVIVNFFPNASKDNLVNDIYRFITPLKRKYSDIFYAIHALANTGTRRGTGFDFLYATSFTFRTIDTVLLPILLELSDAGILENLRGMQQHFDKTGHLWRPPAISPFVWDKITTLAAFLVERRVFAVVNGSQALYFEQAARLLKIAGSIAEEKATVVYCNSCNTVRFRPVGMHLPSSHITLLADVNNNRIHCVDCDSSDLQRINVLGKFVRCFLSTKKADSFVTLALCSACLHISVCGFYANKQGIICKECALTVASLQHIPKVCLACKCAIAKTAVDNMLWTTLDSYKKLSTKYLCRRCTPLAYNMFRQKGCKDPLFLQATLAANAVKENTV
jgi:hypothetical protein